MRENVDIVFYIVRHNPLLILRLWLVGPNFDVALPNCYAADLLLGVTVSP
jgi:hypothetical protein